MIDKLKQEYILRNNLIRYIKLHKSVTNTLIEKNNYDFLLFMLQDIKDGRY